MAYHSGAASFSGASIPRTSHRICSRIDKGSAEFEDSRVYEPFSGVMDLLRTSSDSNGILNELRRIAVEGDKPGCCGVLFLRRTESSSNLWDADGIYR